MAGAVSRWNRERRFAVFPWQTQGLLDEVGLTEQQCREAAWFVDERGRAFRGAAAMNEALRRLGGVFRVASWLYRVPGLRQIEDIAYAWVARNRWRMPGGAAACGTPAEPGVDHPGDR